MLCRKFDEPSTITNYRYHFYSSERQLDKSTVLKKSKALYLERQLVN